MRTGDVRAVDEERNRARGGAAWALRAGGGPNAWAADRGRGGSRQEERLASGWHAGGGQAA